MKILLLTILLYLFNFVCISAQTKQDSLQAQILLSSQIEYTQDSSLIAAARCFKQFLATKDINLVEQTAFTKAAHAQILLDLVFVNNLDAGTIPQELLKIQIFDYEKTEKGILFKAISCYEFPDDKTSFTIIAIFKCWVIQTSKGYKIKLWTDDYLKGFTKKETKWAVYYAQHNKYLQPQLLRKTNQYCDSLAKQFGVVQPPKVTYIIIEPNPNAMQLFGLEYYWTDINFIDRNLGLIIDNKTASPFYPHEWSHYVLRQFTDKKILMEGLATYTSGKANDITTFKNEVNLLKKEANYKDTKVLKNLLYGKEMFWFQYPLGALLCKKAYEVGGIELLKTLQNMPKNQDILEIITQVFKLTQQTPEEFVMQLIDEYK